MPVLLSNIGFDFNLAAPMMLPLMLGALLRDRRFINEASIDADNRLVFSEEMAACRLGRQPSSPSRRRHLETGGSLGADFAAPHRHGVDLQKHLT